MRELTEEEKENERWVRIPGWEFYAVSDMGRVYSLSRTIEYTHGRGVCRTIPGKELKQHRYKDGYYHVKLSRPMIGAKTYNVHTLVLQAFGGDRCPGEECLHLSGDKTDNRLINLRWGTRSENARQKCEHGNMPDYNGSKCGTAKLTEDQVAEIRELKGKLSQREIAKMFGVSHTTIGKIHNGESWRK